MMRRLASLLGPFVRPLAIDDGTPVARRVEEALSRDLESALPEPPEDLGARIARRLRSEPAPVPRPVVGGGSAHRVAALVGVAGLAAAGLFAWLAPPPSEVEPAEESVVQAAPDALSLALRDDLRELWRAPASGLRSAVEAPLLVEARQLAGDGERVARALVATLPTPLRAPWFAPSAE